MKSEITLTNHANPHYFFFDKFFDEFIQISELLCILQDHIFNYFDILYHLRTVVKQTFYLN